MQSPVNYNFNCRYKTSRFLDTFHNRTIVFNTKHAETKILHSTWETKTDHTHTKRWVAGQSCMRNQHSRMNALRMAEVWRAATTIRWRPSTWRWNEAKETANSQRTSPRHRNSQLVCSRTADRFTNQRTSCENLGKYAKPHCFSHVNMNTLSLAYTNSGNAWMTAKIFQEWFYTTFAPAVRRHMQQQSRDEKAVLLLLMLSFSLFFSKIKISLGNTYYRCFEQMSVMMTNVQ